jgi:hypothetical protein
MKPRKQVASRRRHARTALFNRVHVPTIACIDRSTVPMGIDFDALIAALQRFIDEHVAPVWGTRARLVKATRFLKGKWAMVFLDHVDHPHSLGYHDLTPDGLPMCKVFVKSTLKHRKPVSVVASHEIVEMLVDPSINLVTMKPRGRLVYGYETADPVEGLTFKIDGVPVTNFVYPAYFESFHKPGSVRFDHMGKLRRPFEIHAGGYQGVLRSGKWVALFASLHKRRRFHSEDRRGHRGHLRMSGKDPRLSKVDSTPATKRKRRGESR